VRDGALRAHLCGTAARVGRSGLSWKREAPALAMSWPVPVQSTTSLASSWSRMRSSCRPALASGTCGQLRAGAAGLGGQVVGQRIERGAPRFRPASSAPSTLTSNQLSIERATNW
jgi:hypothetical protein